MMRNRATLFACLISLAAMAQKDPYSYNGWGGQLGYAFYRAHSLSLGLNYYHSYNPDYSSKKFKTHTFGPSAEFTVNFLNGTTYLGERVAFDYHYHASLSYRICAGIEHPCKDLYLAGGEIGFSMLGVFLYYGYYGQVGEKNIPGISNHRIGIKLVLNDAPMEVIDIF